MLASAAVGASGPWTLGIIIGVPIAVLIILACLAFSIFAFKKAELGLGWGGLGATLVLILVTLGCTFPWSSEYHQWRPVSGTVQAVSHRLISDGDKSMSERYVVKIDGQPFGVDDTRAGLLHKGDHVDLACKKEWQYASESGWACRWR